VNLAELDRHSDINEARIDVGLTVPQCLELCAVSQRTWYRWRSGRAPIWAIRLILSQHGSLDRFGWPHWEIRRGVLYCNELHHRYNWEPVHLLLPLYGITDRAVLHGGDTDNVSPLVRRKNRREVEKGLYLPDQAIPGPTHNCA
jgi:hypothetical protein